MMPNKDVDNKDVDNKDVDNKDVDNKDVDNKDVLLKKTYRKELRSKMVEGSLNYLRGSGLSDKMTGFLLKSLHFHIPWYFLLLFILLPIKIAIIPLFPLLIAFFFFIYLRSCFLTIVEYKLCHDDTNIIDPYIMLCKDEINETTRYKYTLGVAFIYFFVVFVILYLRYTQKL